MEIYISLNAITYQTAFRQQTKNNQPRSVNKKVFELGGYQLHF